MIINKKKLLGAALGISLLTWSWSLPAQALNNISVEYNGLEVSYAKDYKNSKIFFSGKNYDEWKWHRSEYSQGLRFGLMVDVNNNHYFATRSADIMPTDLLNKTDTNKIVLYATLGPSAAKSAIALDNITNKDGVITATVFMKDAEPNKPLTMNLIYPSHTVIIDNKTDFVMKTPFWVQETKVVEPTLVKTNQGLEYNTYMVRFVDRDGTLLQESTININKNSYKIIANRASTNKSMDKIIYPYLRDNDKYMATNLILQRKVSPYQNTNATIQMNYEVARATPDFLSVVLRGTVKEDMQRLPVIIPVNINLNTQEEVMINDVLKTDAESQEALKNLMIKYAQKQGITDISCLEGDIQAYVTNDHLVYVCKKDKYINYQEIFIPLTEVKAYLK